MEERREVLLPDQKQHKEDDGKKKLGEEGEKEKFCPASADVGQRAE